MDVSHLPIFLLDFLLCLQRPDFSVLFLDCISGRYLPSRPKGFNIHSLISIQSLKSFYFASGGRASLFYYWFLFTWLNQDYFKPALESLLCLRRVPFLKLIPPALAEAKRRRGHPPSLHRCAKRRGCLFRITASASSRPCEITAVNAFARCSYSTEFFDASLIAISEK